MRPFSPHCSLTADLPSPRPLSSIWAPALGLHLRWPICGGLSCGEREEVGGERKDTGHSRQNPWRLCSEPQTFAGGRISGPGLSVEVGAGCLPA